MGREGSDMPARDPARKASAGEQATMEQHHGSITKPSSEDLFIRSYDHRLSYDIDVEVRTPDGQVVFQNRYYLLPGHIASETNVLPNSEVLVDVALDNEPEASVRCEIDEQPEHTVMIEVGNGALSLTQGVTSGQ